ncbi:MAG: DUF333 domain-containing protein [Candidatus Micrarchaeota archaeon]|nr:DUF333 domain-containing protein [Candidatus Micrarchaeota archaeon]
MDFAKSLAILGILGIILLFGCAQGILPGGLNMTNQTPAGASCGTVTPGYNDACCASRNTETIHIMCVGEWKYHATGNLSTECSWDCGYENPANGTLNCGSHQLGESWRSEDGCNTCGCTERGPVCTLMACSNGTGMANPAAVYCSELGYTYSIQTASDGSQSGFCVLPDGLFCEEWAFFRGECGSKWANLSTDCLTSEPSECTRLRIGELLTTCSYTLRLDDVGLAYGPTNEHPAQIQIYRSGALVESLDLFALNGTYSLPVPEGILKITTCITDPGITLASKWADMKLWLENDGEPVFCTMEAMLCPDGVTYVGRNSSLNCSFDPCPTGKRSGPRILPRTD